MARVYESCFRILRILFVLLISIALCAPLSTAASYDPGELCLRKDLKMLCLDLSQVALLFTTPEQ